MLRLIKKYFSVSLSAVKVREYETPTIWYKCNKLTQTTSSISLGQGAPDWAPPDFFEGILTENILKGNHQYTRSYGDINLVQSISRNYSESYNRQIDPMTEVLVSTGAGSLLYDVFTSLLNPNEEVILIEPFYDCYLPQTKLVNGKVVGVSMNPPKSDFEGIKKALNQNTKLLVLNTPHNPTGKVLSFDELNQIVDILKSYPKVIVVMDEVYEHLVYDEIIKLPRMATLQGMWDKTITIHSAGKIFSATGCRVGWAIGPKHLINALHSVNQYSSFCMHGPTQTSIGQCLDIAAKEKYRGYDNYYKWLRQHYQDHRDYFYKNMNEIGDFKGKFWLPEGAYFILCNISNTRDDIECPHAFHNETPGNYTKDVKYVLNLANNKKVVAIPMSYFYTEKNLKIGTNQVRFAFCKEYTTMDKAINNLKRF